MNWTVRVAKRAQKTLRRAPPDDRKRLHTALGQLANDPYSGDVVELRKPLHRRRIGDYRILFNIYVHERLVDVTDITRRTSTTYRKH